MPGQMDRIKRYTISAHFDVAVPVQVEACTEQEAIAKVRTMDLDFNKCDSVDFIGGSAVDIEDA